MVLLGDVGGTMSLDEGMSSLNKRFTRSHSCSFSVGKVAGVYDERGSFQKMVNVTLPNDISTFQYVFVLIGDQNEIK